MARRRTLANVHERATRTAERCFGLPSTSAAQSARARAWQGIRREGRRRYSRQATCAMHGSPPLSRWPPTAHIALPVSRSQGSLAVLNTPASRRLLPDKGSCAPRRAHRTPGGRKTALGVMVDSNRPSPPAGTVDSPRSRRCHTPGGKRLQRPKENVNASPAGHPRPERVPKGFPNSRLPAVARRTAENSEHRKHGASNSEDCWAPRCKAVYTRFDSGRRL
jgi:hypothetical protein